MELLKTGKTGELVAFLQRDYANNLYFFSYLDELSRLDAETAVWVAWKNGAIVLALLVSPVHCCVSAADYSLIDAVAGRLPSLESVHVLGRSDLTCRLLSLARSPARWQKFYSFCKLNPERLPDAGNCRSVKAAATDLPTLIRLYAKTNILAHHETRLPALLRSGTVYLAKEGDSAVSCALTTIETSEMAMIGAVFTDETHRNRGLATDCMVNLCRDLAARGKEVYLFYERDNPLLGRLYAKMGFTITGKWVVATISRDPYFLKVRNRPRLLIPPGATPCDPLFSPAALLATHRLPKPLTRSHYLIMD